MRSLLAMALMAATALPLTALPITSLPITADPPKAAKPAIATVDYQRLTNESAAGQAALAEIDKFTKETGDKIGKLQTERDKIVEQIKSGMLKDAEKKTLAKKAEDLDAQAAKLQLEGEWRLKALHRRSQTLINREAERLIREHAKANGIDLVVDVSPGMARVFLADPDADITDALLKKMEAFKIKPPEVFKPDPADKEMKPQVIIRTSMGDITVELDRAKAPITVANFLKYVEDKHYDGTIFHRVIGDFMIQGGGYTEKLVEKETRDPIPLETQKGHVHERGTIAMAREDDPDSAASEFFINVVENAKLNFKEEAKPGYAVFGKVVKGMEVVDKIKNVKTASRRGMNDVPVETVLIKSAERVKK